MGMLMRNSEPSLSSVTMAYSCARCSMPRVIQVHSGRSSTAVFLTVIGDTVGELTDDFLRLISGAVIYDDDFKIPKSLTEYAPNRVADEALAVKHRDHDADLR